MSEPLRLTLLYEEGEDGWVVARVREVPAAMSQGRTRDEARENALDALRELVLSYLDDGDSPFDAPAAATEALYVTLAR